MTIQRRDGWMWCETCKDWYPPESAHSMLAEDVKMLYSRHAEHHWQALVEHEKFLGRSWSPLVFWIGYAATVVIALR